MTVATAQISESLQTLIDSRLDTLASSLTDGASQAIHSIDSRLTYLTTSLTEGTVQAIQSIDARLTHLTSSVNTDATLAIASIDARLTNLTSSVTTGTAQAIESIDARLTNLTSSVTTGSTEAIESAAVSANLDRQVQLVRAWFGASDEERAAWPEGPFSVDAWLHVTPAELSAYGEELMAVVHRWANRDIPEDGQDRDMVFTFARAAPARP